MQQVLFNGRVLPSIHNLTVPLYSLEIADNNFASQLSVEIHDSVVTVSILVENFAQEMLGELCRRAIRVVKASIDLVSFSTGKGLILVLDRVSLPDGRSGPVDLDAPSVRNLCTAYTLQNLATMMALVLPEQDIYMALGDLTETITQPDRTQVNCGRVVETIRTLIDPNPQRRLAWNTLSERLNISASYLKLITDQSIAHRHGDYVETDNELGGAVRDRTWSVMNRFLEYRLGGNQTLPLAEFPLLDV
jgi:hypothetical protein